MKIKTEAEVENKKTNFKVSWKTEIETAAMKLKENGNFIWSWKLKKTKTNTENRVELKSNPKLKLADWDNHPAAFRLLKKVIKSLQSKIKITLS